MKDFEIIIKDKTGKELETEVQKLDTDKNKVYIISLVTGDIPKDTSLSLVRLMVEKLSNFGVNNVLVIPVKDREHIIDIKEIELD